MVRAHQPLGPDSGAARQGRAGDGLLRDSSVIAAYLDREFPSPSLYPASAWDYAQAMWLEEYADSDLIARVGGQVFRPRLIGLLTGKPCDETLVAKALTKNLPRFLLIWTAVLRGGTISWATVSALPTSRGESVREFQSCGRGGGRGGISGARGVSGAHARRESFMPAIAHEKAQMARMGKAK